MESSEPSDIIPGHSMKALDLLESHGSRRFKRHQPRVAHVQFWKIVHIIVHSVCTILFKNYIEIEYCVRTQ